MGMTTATNAHCMKSATKRKEILLILAFAVSMRLGLDTSSYSMGYIQSWLKDKEELKIIADTV